MAKEKIRRRYKRRKVKDLRRPCLYCGSLFLPVVSSYEYCFYCWRFVKYES